MPETTQNLTGRMIGAYRLQSLLGRGGSGAVYLATREDGEFDMQVAIKVTRPSRTDAAMLARFRSERQILAGLEHPNIARLLDGGTTEEGLPYFIMEYVPGLPIDRYCDQAELGITARLALFQRVSEAVAFAHARNIVHRDLKPGNIMVHDDGSPKLLDFGIAKLASAATSETEEKTASGAFVMTPAFASPEQYLGERITPLTDVYSLGVVLYLLLSGQHPHALARARGIDLRRAICNEDPPTPGWILSRLGGLRTPISSGSIDTTAVTRPHGSDSGSRTTGSSTPLDPRLDAIVMKCIARAPEARYQSVAALIEDIARFAAGEGVAAPLVTVDLAWANESALTGASRAASGVASVLKWVVPTLALAVIGYGLWPKEQPVQPVAFVLEPPAGTVFTGGARNVPAVAPDGQRILFVATDQTTGESGLWLRGLGGLDAERIRGTEQAENPFWSPDGRAIGFFANRSLQIVGLDGSPPRRVTTASMEPRGGTMNAAGTILYAPDLRDGLYRVGLNGGDPDRITEPDREAGELGHAWPVFLPDGIGFLYYVSSNDDHVRGIYYATLDEPKGRLVQRSVASAFFASGRLIYLRAGSLMARRFDTSSARFTGPEQVVVHEASPTLYLQGAFSASTEGLLAYSSGEADDIRRIVWLTESGEVQRQVSAAGRIRNLALFGAQRVAYEVHDSGSSVVMIADATSGSVRPAVRMEANTYHPVWSPDGQRLVFSSDLHGFNDIFMTEVDSTLPAVLLWRSDSDSMPTSWTPDGSRIAFAERTSRGDYDVLTLDPELSGSADLLLGDPANEAGLVFSPHGDMVAYVADYTGSIEVYAQRFPLGRSRCQISTGGGYDPVWGDGGSLYYLDSVGQLVRRELRIAEACELGEATLLFDAGIRTPNVSRNHFALSGGQVLLNRPVPELSPFRILYNWPEMLSPSE